MKPIDDAKARAYAAHVPTPIKEKVWSGEITLAQAGDMVMAEAKSRGLPAPPQDTIEKVFGVIEAENPDPPGEDDDDEPGTDQGPDGPNSPGESEQKPPATKGK